VEFSDDLPGVNFSVDKGGSMGKIVLFSILWWVLGNPFVAILVLLLIVYVLDRRFVGLFPSVTRPIRRMQRINRLKRDVSLNPNDTSSRMELAYLNIERGRYREALDMLNGIADRMEDSPDVWYGIALCRLKMGELERGEQEMLHSLELNPRIRFGEPYLRLGEAFVSTEPRKAMDYLQKFQDFNSSSCEGYYRMGIAYLRTGNRQEAKEAFREAVRLYQLLPKYKRRSERRWALLAAFRSSGL
jgi:tetratricopeptide (TPR) repeat protein